MAWNINYAALQAFAPGAPPAPAPAAPAPAAPAPAAPPAYNAGGGGNAILPAPGGGSTAGSTAGGDVNLDFETFKTKAASDAAYAAYLSAKSQNDTEETAIHKAVAEANRVYQEQTIAMQGQQLTTTRQQAYNQGMADFERSGVATSGRIAGLNALRAPLPPLASPTAGTAPGNPQGLGLPATSTMSASPYSVAAPNTQGLFRNNGTNLGPAAHAFLRSDMTYGLSNTASDYTPGAISELLGAAARNQVTPTGQFGQQVLSRLQAGTLTPDQLAALSPSIGPGGARSPGALASGGSF